MLEITRKYLVTLIIFYILHTAYGDIQSDVKNKVEKLEERSRRLYGDAPPGTNKQWELDANDVTSYPNGDEKKLAQISHLWISYYRCTARAAASVTWTGHLPSVNVAVYEGQAARLPCGLCVAPGEAAHVTWFYAESLHNAVFTPLKYKNMMTTGVNITIYKVELTDAGVYHCRLGGSVSGLLVLQVLDDHEYHVVNAASYPRSPVAVQTASTLPLVIFMSWSPWSECSTCDRVGWRRRYGLCYLRLNNKLEASANTSDAIFQEYPDGIACGSRLLPATLLRYPTITNRKNIIMTEPCKIPCDQIFHVHSKPPPPARDIIFTEYGDKLTLKCPGTTLRDIPVTWRRGNEQMGAGVVDGEPPGRVHLNARDQIVFTAVEYGDTNVYSCWQSAGLAGVIKLQVHGATRLAPARPAAVAGLVLLAVALRRAVTLLRTKLRRARRQ